MTRLDLDKLKESDYGLFQIASRASGCKTGMCEIEISRLKIFPETRLRLAQVSLDQEAARAAAEEARRKAAAPPPQQVVELPPQISMAEVERENQQDMKFRADAAEAKARLQQYVDEQGLEPSQHNLDVISAWLRQNLKGYWSSTGIDVAIQTLGPRGTDTLRWKPKVAEPPPAPPPPAEPTEVLGNLPNGEPRLPLDKPIPPKASKEQAKDWLDRFRKEKPYVRSSGSFSSRF
jgi:hypothetical protein